jgi:diguanylate cyclase (GGDEF)-like protein
VTEEPRNSILVVDDDRNLRSIIASNLELAGYSTREVADGAAALAYMDSDVPDLVLLDVMLPAMDGYEVCRRIRKHPTCAHIPIIMLTARGETEDAVMGFEAGADDYIVKPFSPQEMLARVRAKIRRVNVDSSLQPLTRLPGNVAIEAEVQRRFRDRIPWGVLYLDLDNFKAFNDVYGFVRGDDAIRLLATTLSNAVRHLGEDGDFVGHIGGDDFIAVTSPTHAERIAQEVIVNFDRDVKELYAFEDLRRGYIETRDRRNVSMRYPIMSVSIAIVAGGTTTTYQQIGEVAAELKKLAKRQPGSVFVTDKRRS